MTINVNIVSHYYSGMYEKEKYSNRSEKRVRIAVAVALPVVRDHDIEVMSWKVGPILLRISGAVVDRKCS